MGTTPPVAMACPCGASQLHQHDARACVNRAIGIAKRKWSFAGPRQRQTRGVGGANFKTNCCTCRCMHKREAAPWRCKVTVDFRRPCPSLAARQVRSTQRTLWLDCMGQARACASCMRPACMRVWCQSNLPLLLLHCCNSGVGASWTVCTPMWTALLQHWPNCILDLCACATHPLLPLHCFNIGLHQVCMLVPNTCTGWAGRMTAIRTGTSAWTAPAAASAAAAAML